jgi:hypothetical protein
MEHNCFIASKYSEGALYIPKDGGFDEKWIEPSAVELEKDSNATRPSGSQFTPWPEQKQK